MTDKKDDNSSKTTAQPSTGGTTNNPPPASGGGKGLAGLALVVALAAGGGSGYLWQQADQDKKARQAEAAKMDERLDQRLTKSLTKVVEQREADLQSLKASLATQQSKAETLQGDTLTHKGDIENLRNEDQVLKADLHALQGGLQTLKGSLETQKGSVEIQKTDVRNMQSDVRNVQGDIQSLKGEIQGLAQNEIQPLKTNLETQSGGAQILKSEIQALEDRAQALQSNIQNLTSQLEGLAQTQQSSAGQLATQLENLQLAQRGLSGNLDAVKAVAARGGDVNALPLSEVEYLLRMADHKLKLQADVSVALEALNIAAERLEDINEDGFLAVQRMVKENAATLRGVELPDISGLAHKISEMAQRATTLPLLIDIKMSERKAQVKPQTEGTVPWWEQASSNAWGELKDIVVIRNERSSGPPLIAVEEEYFLRQNLRLQLEAMRLALAQADASAYQDTGNLAKQWIETYFDTKEAAVTDLLAELETLKTVQFNPYIPDISSTLRAFRDVMQRREPIRTVTAQPAMDADAAGAEGNSGEAQQ